MNRSGLFQKYRLPPAVNFITACLTTILSLSSTNYPAYSASTHLAPRVSLAAAELPPVFTDIYEQTSTEGFYGPQEQLLLRHLQDALATLEQHLKKNPETDLLSGYDQLYASIGENLLKLQELNREPVIGKKPALGLNTALTQEILRTGQMSPKQIADPRLKNFLQLLRDNGLNDLVVIGGAAKDHLLGDHTSVLNVTLKLRGIDDIRRGRYSIPFIAGDAALWQQAKPLLARLANALGVSVDQLLLPQDHPEVATFAGIPVGYIGPLQINNMVIKQYIVDETSRSVLSSVSGPSILNLAIDSEGKFYGHWIALRDLLAGRVSIHGQARDLTVIQIMRIFASAAEFDLIIPKEDKNKIKQRVRELLLTPLLPDQQVLAARIHDKYRRTIAARRGEPVAERFDQTLKLTGIENAIYAQRLAPNLADLLQESGLMGPAPTATVNSSRNTKQLLNIISRLFSRNFHQGTGIEYEQQLKRIDLDILNPEEVAEVLRTLDTYLSITRMRISISQHSGFLPQTVAAHELTTVIPSSGQMRRIWQLDHERLGVAVLIYQTLLERLRPQRSNPVVGLNIALLLKVIRTGKIDPEDMDRDTNAFLRFLRQHNLKNVLLVGGTVRDILYGRKIDDFDLGLVIDSLGNEERGIAQISQAEASEMIWNQADTAIKNLAALLGTDPIFLFRSGDPAAPRFRGRTVEWAGPLRIFKTGTTLRQMMAERKTRELYPSSSGPANLRVGMDADGNVYGIRGLLNYVLGKITIDGDGKNFSMGAVLRTLRLHYEFGLDFDEDVEQAIRTSVQGYLNGSTQIGTGDYAIVTKQIGKIRKALQDAPARRKHFEHTLKRLHIDTLLLMLESVHKNHSLPINIDTISQKILPIYWQRLNISANRNNWMLDFNSLVLKRIGRIFFREALQDKTVSRIELLIGNDWTREDLQRGGWRLGESTVVPGLGVTVTRASTGKKIKYIFSDIMTDSQLHFITSMLKSYSVPLHRTVIQKKRKTTLRDYYDRSLSGDFSGIKSLLIGLNIFIDPLTAVLQAHGWILTDEKCGPAYRYRIAEKNNVKIAIAYANEMEGNATTEFIQQAWKQGVRNVTFWGTAGGLQVDQQYMDDITVQDVYHVDNPEINKLLPGVSQSSRLAAVHTLGVDSIFSDTVENMRNFSQMGLSAVEMELYYLAQWICKTDPGITLDVHINLSEVLSWPDHIAHRYNSLKEDEKMLLFRETVSRKIGTILDKIYTSDERLHNETLDTALIRSTVDATDRARRSALAAAQQQNPSPAGTIFRDHHDPNMVENSI